MRISRLELFGFKSFPDRTSMQFGRGISCVVGPNGSGKSNVVDALKWVIGEQSARSLRGAEMADVIFAGSTERKPVGFAEVSLTLDVDGGEPFPGAYANLQELQVGRRLHRTGASEYLINQVKCRRKDVVDLFLDTGIGTNLYSFIEQGRVDKVVSATPNERRGLIDEAAGISRYKARREEARGRLEATAQQLDRAADVADEMGRRLKVLERQVVKAARYRQARAQVRQREIFLALVKYRGLAEDRRALQKALRDARSEEAAARRGLLRREEDLRVRREELGSVDDAARSWRDELAEVDARLRELASQRSLQGQRAAEAAENVEGAERELAEIQAEAVTVDEQLGKMQGALDATKAALAGEGEGADERAARREASAKQVAKAGQARDQADRAWQDLRDGLTRLAAEASAIEERRSALPGALVKLEAQLADLGVQTEELHRLHAEAVQEQQVREGAEVAAEAEVERAVAALEAVDGERERRLQAHEARRAQALKGLTVARQALDAHRRRVDEERAARAVEREEQAARARRERDRALHEARQRSDAWVDGVVEEAGRCEASARQALESEADRWRTLEGEAEGEARRAAEDDAARRIEGAEQQVRQSLQPLERAVRRHRDALARARGDAEQARVSLAEADARIAALRGRLEATERPEALAHALPLVDRLPPDQAADALRAWGRPATLPALDDAAAIAHTVQSLPEGTSAELWWWRSRSPPTIVEAGSVEEALSVHEAKGLDVRFPGGRVQADGIVTVGLHDVAAARVESRQRLAEVEAKAAELHDARALALRGAETAETALEHAESELAEGRRQADRALAQARRTAMEHVQTHVRQTLDAFVVERDTSLASLRDRVAGQREEGAREVQRARDRREGALEQVVRALDRQLEEALSALPPVDGSGADAEEEALALAVVASAAQVEASEAVPELPGRATCAEAVAHSQQTLRAAVEARISAQGNVGRVEQQIEGLSARVAETEERAQDLRQEVERWAARATEVAEARAIAEAAGAAAQEQREAAESRWAEEQERHQALVLETEGADAARRALLERLDGQQAQRSALLQQQTRLSARATAVRARHDEAASRRDDARRASEVAAQEVEVHTVARGEVYDKLSRERARRSELQEGIRAAEGDLNGLRERLQIATRTTQERVDRTASVRADIEALRQRMDERYQVGLPGLLDRIERSGRVLLEADEEVAAGVQVGTTEVEGVEAFELRRALLDDEAAVRSAVEVVEALRRRLSQIGEVHLGAVEEYTELAERYGDLEVQRADLEASVSQLRAAIAKMNRTCRERFREAFDQVNENFQVSYPKLLGGGSARLALTDDEDLLETGVEIFVQPPGKRLQHLQLLSGGEKAMTAIALLIALFRVKPSPFCVLDEVDAPLDERNGGRFNTMLRELAQTSQFVVITHNRKTMECADTLYGISMTRPGVSTLVTVSLADAEA